MRKYICVRHRKNDGQTRGWCGTVHRYEDRAHTHCRQLDRSFLDDHWDVHDADDATARHLRDAIDRDHIL